MQTYRFSIISIVFLLFAGGLWLYGPIPQDQAYHNYADQRTLFGIVNFYALAKFCEHFDQAIYDVIRIWSGHTLKHFFSGISLYYAVKLIVAWEKELIS